MTTISLGKVCNIVMGQAPPGNSYNNNNNGLPLIAGASDFGSQFPKPQKYTTSPTKISSKGDILLCIRATIGDINWSDRKYCLGRGIAGLKPNSDKLDSNYLWYWIKSNQRYIAHRGKGSTFKQISKEPIELLQIPEIPIAEQKRIAAILDKADAIHRKRRQTLDLSDQFLRSVFLDMFGDPVINHKGWPIKPLSEVTSLITDGVHRKPNYTNEGIPFISVKNITTGRLDFTDCKFISSEEHRNFIKRCKPEYLDVLYTKVGATYGRPAIVDTKKEFSLYVSVALIKPNQSVINPIFLKESLATRSLKNQADRAIKGIGVPDLHLTRIIHKIGRASCN